MSRIKKPTDIDRLRKKIDLIDSELASLLRERVHLASHIIKAKETLGAATADPKRERAIVMRYRAALRSPIKPKQVHTLVRAILGLTPEYRD